MRHADLFRNLAAEAREERRGLWSLASAATSPPAASPVPASPAPVASPDRNCTDFPTWSAAQDFCPAAGGPARETLPGAGKA
ncbi:MAG: hypothetical protein EXR49_06475 [Dehalococcoidia bacterium]|nr:hypothetical protein [Dehalococcoidia bacterium]